MMEEDEDVKLYMKQMKNRAMKKEEAEYEDIEEEEEKTMGATSAYREGI
jgi:hypothetical protein